MYKCFLNLKNKINSFFLNFSLDLLVSKVYKFTFSISNKFKKKSKSNETKFKFFYKEKSKVYFVIGDCGAGKTSYAVRKAQKLMKKDYPVYSNFFIKGAYKLQLSDLMQYCMEDNAVVIIDEGVSQGLSSRGSAAKQNSTPNVVEYFSTFRHYKAKLIIVISPSFEDIIPAVRNRSNKVLYITNSILSNIGVGKYKLIKKHVDIVGENPPREYFHFLPLFRFFYLTAPTFKMYDSFVRKTLFVKVWHKW